MDIADLVRTPLRRWMVVVPLLLATMLSSAALYAGAPVTYEVSLVVGLTGPPVDRADRDPDTPFTGANPYIRHAAELEVARGAVVEALNARAAVGTPPAPGTVATYELKPVTSSGPWVPTWNSMHGSLIEAVATSPDEAVARRTAEAAAGAVGEELEVWQSQAGVPRAKRITTEVVSPTGPATELRVTATRKVALVLIMGAAAAFGAAFALESIARSRRDEPVLVPAVPGWRDPVGLLSLSAVALLTLSPRLAVAGIGYDSMTPAKMAGAIALLWWIAARMVRSSGMPAGPQPIRPAIGLFAGAILVSYVAAMTRPILADELRGADRLFFAMLTGFGVALLAADGIPSRARLDTLLRRVVLCCAFMATIGILQFTIGFDLAGWLRIPGLSATRDLGFITERLAFRRVAGTTNHPIEFGVVLAVVLPLALHFALRPGARRAWRWAQVGLIATAIPMSLSRSALLGVAVVCMFLFPTWTGRQRAALAGAAVAFVAVMQVAVPGLLNAILSLFLNLQDDPSYQGRTEDYDVVGKFIGMSPIIGRGLGTFRPSRYVLLDNQYLGAMIEIGVVGLVALVLLFGIGALTARAARRRAGRDVAAAGLGQSLLASIVALAIAFGTFDRLSFPVVTGLLFLLLGCTGALWRLTTPRPVELKGPGRRRTAPPEGPSRPGSGRRPGPPLTRGLHGHVRLGSIPSPRPPGG